MSAIPQRAYAPGVSRQKARINAKLDPPPEARTVAEESTQPELLPEVPTAISGTVTDWQGVAIANAEVAAYHPDRGSKTTKSDAQGHFTIRNLETDMTYRVSAIAPHCNEAAVDGISPGSSDIELKLTAASAARGTVIDAATRTPLTEFEIAYLPYVPDEKQWAAQSLETSISWERVRDIDGRFSANNILSGAAFAIAARAKDHGAAFIICDALGPGATVDNLVIPLPSGASLSGRVTASDGSAVAGATIYMGSTNGKGSAQSNADGTFRIEGLAASNFIITAKHDDHGETSAEVTTTQGRETKVELKFPAGGSIEGVVTNSGAPAGGARVLAAVNDSGTYRHAKVNETGQFSISGLPAGNYDLFADIPNDDGGFDSDKQMSASAEVEVGKITFVTLAFQPATASITVRVTMSDAPMTDAAVRGVIGTDGGDKNFTATADTDGVYRAERLPPGAAYVEVIANQPSGPLKRALTFPLRDGEDAQHVVDFDAQVAITGKITTLAEGEHAEVIVVAGKTDADLNNAEELLAVRHMASGVAEMNEDGTFRVEGLEPGDYTVIAVVFNPDDDAGNPLDTMRLTKEAVTLANETLELDLAP
ncbi:MAG: carboxypeptidase regulatory-like domain-containing protein [Candidatus Hydrogenedentes bacterium]|nr:carboxypeptidase regulatory-like domain-containing protein [Candidatus Hydrogenedentota bacterium]